MATDPYQQSWQGRERAQQYDRNADVLVPRRAEMLANIVRILPYGVDTPIRVLDLGAGTGALEQAILARYPQASVTGVDSAAGMIEIGLAKLAGYGEQVHLLLRDLEKDDWNAGLEGPWDAIVSAMAIHILSDESKQRLYRQCFAMLKPGGWFVCADRLKAASPALDELYHELWLEHMVRQTKEVLGKDVPLETMRQRQRSLDQAAGLHRVTLEQSLSWLHAAGFASVDCFWKDWQRAIFGGMKE